MNISYRSLILLYCIHQIKCERSIYGVFHILTGKKSSQTIVDGEFFQLSPLFSVLKKLKRIEFIKHIDELSKKNLIEAVDENIYKLTTNGQQTLEQHSSLIVPAYINGWKYYDAGIQFWQRLSLIIQVLSNLIRDKRNYITIQQDQHILTWAKQYLLTRKESKQELASAIYKECEECLSVLSEDDAMIFVLRLSSSGRIGYTNQQIGSMLSLDEEQVEIYFMNVIHFMLMRIEHDPLTFPNLAEIKSTIPNRKYSLTESTAKTLDLLNQGNSLENIAFLRRLKLNTVEDHIVEIAHHVEAFKIEPYVSKEKQEEIIKTQKALDTLKLKRIREALHFDVSYFEIRLVLAKSGVNE
ncbi:helix-turn-helix domain-containing protein [Litchfieldia alkalitelluris]|uniref:helix-turn-helix domain-containing protein n=1 Tax=Litchfieldia alkalitelluris TaxID=304268 RepID=UPI00099620CE|nr:helix-turn-helix domain-containing protein [Litchfieldia alkalitelluris]